MRDLIQCQFYVIFIAKNRIYVEHKLESYISNLLALDHSGIVMFSTLILNIVKNIAEISSYYRQAPVTFLYLPPRIPKPRDSVATLLIFTILIPSLKYNFKSGTHLQKQSLG